jgi:hypothetical protein
MDNMFVTHMAKRVYIKDSTKHGREVQWNHMEDSAF